MQSSRVCVKALWLRNITLSHFYDFCLPREKKWTKEDFNFVNANSFLSAQFSNHSILNYFNLQFHWSPTIFLDCMTAYCIWFLLAFTTVKSPQIVETSFQRLTRSTLPKCAPAVPTITLFKNSFVIGLPHVNIISTRVELCLVGH